MKKRRLKFLGLLIVALLLLFAAWPVWNARVGPRVLAEANLRDGRILRVEGVSYGRSHVIGTESLILKHFRPWLSQRIAAFFRPAVPQSRIGMNSPGLVVWFNAVDAVTGTNVDCQGVRLEFVDKNGELYESETSSWSSFGSFRRQGNEFHAYPRDEPILTLRFVNRRTRVSADVKIPNPHLTKAREIKGKPLPQGHREGEDELVLEGLNERTNGSPKESWKTPCRFWEPNLVVKRNGRTEQDWDIEWTAEDALGNVGQHLGVSKPVLIFHASAYPRATNAGVRVCLTGPLVQLGKTNIFSNQVLVEGETRVEVLGCFPPGIYAFSDGVYEANPIVSLAPTRGGAPSGWVSTSRRLTPTRVKEYHDHYSDVPVIYVRMSQPRGEQRLALRVRDEAGRCWISPPEPEGSTKKGIMPFLVKVPSDVHSITPELVLLNPLKTDFAVETKSAPDAK